MKQSVLSFFCFFSLYAGYAAGNRLLVCFGFALLFLLFVAWHSAHNLFSDLSVKRIHYRRTFEGDELRITIRLDAKSRLPRYMLEVIDTFPPGDSYRIRSLVSERLNNRARIEVEYRAVCTRRRGVYVLGPLKLFGSDALGIFPRRIELPVLTDLLVYPQAPDLDYFEVLGDGTLSQVGLETLLSPGHSEEFTGLREYRRGDTPRRIHWPSSARHNRLLVKEFREDITTEVTLFLDMHRLTLSGIGNVTSVEYIIKAAAAVAKVAIEKSHLVQLFSLSEKVEHVPIGGGQQHLIMLLDRLTFLRARGEGSFEDALALYAPLLKYGSTAILIADATNIHPQRLSPILRQMTRRHIRVIVILIDDRSFIKVWKDQDFHRRHALPLGVLKRNLFEEGCGLFVIAKDDDISMKLQVPTR